MERNRNLDFARSMALLFVISIYAIGQVGFYNQPFDNVYQLILSIMRVLFRSCVPLFIMISGWLQKQERFDKFYAIKLSRIIVTYVVIGITCVCFEQLKDGHLDIVGGGTKIICI